MNTTASVACQHPDVTRAMSEGVPVPAGLTDWLYVELVDGMVDVWPIWDEEGARFRAAEPDATGLIRPRYTDGSFGPPLPSVPLPSTAIEEEDAR